MKHTKGKDCKACCCSGPSRCEVSGCSGWVHLSVADEIQVDVDDWEWVHDYKCDTCGKTYLYYDAQECDIEFEEENI